MPQEGWHCLFQWWLKHWTWFFWIMVLIVAAQQAVRWFRISAARSKNLPDGPKEILKLRCACGEIDRSEYKRRLDALRRLRRSA